MSHEEKPILPLGNDLFHRGVITKLFPSNNTGIVRIESGREVFFSYEFVIVIGEARSPLSLKVGQTVGYDLGWTPSGLRITKIKTYPPASEIRPGGSKGQGG